MVYIVFIDVCACHVKCDVYFFMCDYAGSENNEEQYECVPGQPQGYVDVPPYSSSVASSVTEDWDRGMILTYFWSQ